MKKVFYSIICAVTFLALFSCSSIDNDAKQKPEDIYNQNYKEPSDTTKQIINNESMSEPYSKVESLTKELESVKNKNNDSIKKMESQINTWRWISIGTCALFVIALLLSLLKKGLQREDVDEIFDKKFNDERRIKKLQMDVNSILSQQRQTSQNGNSSNSNYDTRLRLLERRMSEVVHPINGMVSQTQLTPPNEPTKPQEPEFQKVGYARNDNDVYFMTIYDSNQEGCVFKITFKSASRGEFSIISLDKILSRNDWQQKVECSGISIKDAKDFRIEEKGVCEKIDESTWKVTKPLKIRLL